MKNYARRFLCDVHHNSVRFDLSDLSAASERKSVNTSTPYVAPCNFDAYVRFHFSA